MSASFAMKKLRFWLGLEVNYPINNIKPEQFVIRKIGDRNFMTISNVERISQKIIYPKSEKNCIWTDEAIKNLIMSVDEMFTSGYCFNVCIVDGAISDFDLDVETPSIAKAHKELSLIHCVHFKDMSPEVFEAIPRHMTHIFTGGLIPIEDIPNEDEFDGFS